MATLQAALREVSGDYSGRLATIPSPEKVRAAAAEIRRHWTPRQRRRRAALARYLLLERLLGAGPASSPALRIRGAQLKPTSRPWR